MAQLRISPLALGAILTLGLGLACSSSSNGAASGADECTALETCCLGLSVTAGATCIEVAQSGVATSCGTELLTLRMAGSCGSVGTSGQGSSTSTVTGTGCAALESCCLALPTAQRAACGQTVAAGSSTACTTDLSVYQSAGLCGAVTSGTGSSVSTHSSGLGTSSGTLTSQTSGTSFTSSFTGTSGTSSQGTDAGGVPECSVPTTSPSAGNCVTVVPSDAGMGIECNPVTNGGCASGDACDIIGDGSGSISGFQCYPPPNTQAICATCDGQTTFCEGGGTCYGATTMSCAKYCCTNADCGAGTCTKGMFAPTASALGVCTMP